ARSSPAEKGFRARPRRSPFRAKDRSLVHPFEQIFKLVESALPEAGHLAGPIDQRRQGTELRAVVRPATFVAVAHQPGLVQDRKMLRDGRLRDSSPRRQSPDRLLSFSAQSLEEGPPGRIGERPEEHIVSVRHVTALPARQPGQLDLHWYSVVFVMLA